MMRQGREAGSAGLMEIWGELAREWRSPLDCRLLMSALFGPEKFHPAGKMDHGMEANLYGSGASGLIKFGREVLEKWGPEGLVGCLGHLVMARNSCVSWLEYKRHCFHIFVLICVYWEYKIIDTDSCQCI